MKNLLNDNSGLAALVTVIVISVATLSIALTIAFSGITEVQTGLFISTSSKALLIADSCAEEAYYRLKLDNSYTGGTINIEGHSCTVAVTGAGPTRSINSSATVNNFTQTIISDISLVTNISTNANGTDLTQWQ